MKIILLTSFKKSPLTIFLIAVYIMLFTGCGVDAGLSEINQCSEEIQNERLQTQQYLEQVRKNQRQAVTIHDTPWVAKHPIEEIIPRIPELCNNDITFATAQPIPFSEFGRLIHKLSGMSVQLTPDAEYKLYKVKKNTKENIEPLIANICWQGKLEGLLDNIASLLNLYWKYDNNTIIFYYLTSKTFQVYALPSTTTITSNIKSSTSASDNGFSATSGQKIGVNTTSDVLNDIKKNVESMLTKEVGILSFSQSTGQMTVTDIPPVLDRIKRYIELENRSISKQLIINIKILSVELNKKNEYGINWNKIFASYQLNEKIANAIGIGSGAFTIKPTEQAIGKAADSNIIELFLKALSEQARVSIVTSPSVTTLNLQPVPLQIGTQKNYLSSIDTITDKKNNETKISLKSTTITYGFNMTLLPIIIENNKVILQYTISMSDLVGIDNFGDEKNGQIQLPVISNRIFSQKVRLRHNETLILSGFEDTKKMVGKPSQLNIFNAQRFGMSQSQNEQKRTIIVIMITPLIDTA